MPVNEFEKQVKQIMEGLQLDPSPPVWNNIEKQVRKKRDRRRLLIWLPLLFLVLGGGIWWTTETFNHNGNKNQQSQNKIKSDEQSTKNIVSQKTDISSKTKSVAEPVLPVIQKNKPGKQFTYPVKHQNFRAKRNKELAEKPGNDQADVKKPIEVKKNDEPVLNQAITLQETDVAKTKDMNENIPQAKTDSTLADENRSNEKHDSLSDQQIVNPIAEMVPTPSPKKPGKNKWQKVIIADIGWSTYSEGIFPDRVTLDYRSAQGSFSNSGPVTGGAAGFYSPQPITKGISFALGFAFRKPVSKKSSFSIGLQYHYFSTHTKTGQEVKKDSTINYGGEAISISRYYKNGNAQSYTNQFHVLEIPLAFEYRIFKSIPLEISAGASYGHLLKTNALTFNRSSNLYYQNKKDYVKNYINVFGSLQYGWLNRNGFKIQSGPIFQYTASELRRENYFDIPHLFFVGVRTGIIFK